jgi:cell division protein FtsB
LSLTKKKKLWKVSIIILCILAPLVFWLGFSDHGFVHLYRTEMERQAYTERIRQLTEENQTLLEEIDRLRTDKKYVESVARKQFNMIMPNEVIYRFDQEKQRDDAKDESKDKK